MDKGRCYSLRNIYTNPALSVMEHECQTVNFEDGLLLPSSHYGRTWLLDNFQETSTESSNCKMTNCEEERCSEGSCGQRDCLTGVIQTECANSRSCERTTCQSGSSSKMVECASQPCLAGGSQAKGFIVQSCQPVSPMMVKCCPPNTCVSKSFQTHGRESSQCQFQSCESSSCRSCLCTMPGSQLLVSSPSIYEPTCCVTGGLPLPSK